MPVAPLLVSGYPRLLTTPFNSACSAGETSSCCFDSGASTGVEWPSHSTGGTSRGAVCYLGLDFIKLTLKTVITTKLNTNKIIFLELDFLGFSK